jgi:gluconolactonase
MYAIVACTCVACAQTPSTLREVGHGFQFTEGPTPDGRGNVLFTDVRASRIYRRTADGQISVFREETGNANGLAFDRAGNLLICEGGRGRVVSLDAQGQLTVVADRYRGVRFNPPNDLWIDPQGGVYFSDPIYGRAERQQDGEHVYYVSADRRRIVRVIDDMVRPNGLAGTPDGRPLYVSDHGAKRVYRYRIESDGTLAQKQLFARVGADGMKLDRSGNLYLAEDNILVFDPAGKRLATIEIPRQPTNLCFLDPEERTLFVTARTAVYAVALKPEDNSSRPASKGGPASR